MILKTYHDHFEKKFKSRSKLILTILEDDEASLFPSEASDYIKEGVLSHFVPKQFGGELQNLVQIFFMGRSLTRRNVSTAIAIGQSFLGSIPVWFEGTKQAQSKLATSLLSGGANCLALTERDHGSDLSATECRLDDWRVSGEKWCINNATLGKSMTVLCEDKGSLTLVFIDKDSTKTLNFKNLPKLKTHGIKGADISGIVFMDYPINENDIIGKPGKGLEIVAKTMQISRTLCASFCLGASDGTLRDTLHFCFTRILYNAPLIKMESVRALLSRSLAKSLVCEALALTATRFASLYPELMSLYSSVVKCFIPQQIDEQIRICAEILGARHYLREDDYPLFQKNLRDHAVVGLFDGSVAVNLSLLYPVLKKLNILRNSKEVTELSMINVDSAIPDIDFSKFKIGLRTFDYTIATFFQFKEASKYFTHNLLVERYKELEENFSDDLEVHSTGARNCALEFIKIFSCMNFMLFCHENRVMKEFKDPRFIDEIIISILDDSTPCSFSESHMQKYRNKLISLFDLDINE